VSVLNVGRRHGSLYELKMFNLWGPSCVYNHSNGLGRIRTSYFAGNNEVSLVTVIFGDPDVYTTVDNVCCSIQANGTNLIS
jgi:hypothetical protein